MKLPKFVCIVPNKSEPAQTETLILHTVAPYEIGTVIKLSPDPLFEIRYKNQFKPLVCSVVQGFSLLICYGGRMDGDFVRVSGFSWESELQQLFNDMSKFYYLEKIINNQNYYRRYKL